MQHDLPIELDDLLPAGGRDGVYRVSVEMNRHSAEADDDQFVNSRSLSLVTLSDIGLTAKRTRDGIVVWAVSLRSAEPLAGVRARVYSSKNQLLGEARTDVDGIATIQHVQPASGEEAAVVLADRVEAAQIEPLGPPMPTTAPSDPAATGLTWLDLQPLVVGIGRRRHRRPGVFAEWLRSVRLQ